MKQPKNPELKLNTRKSLSVADNLELQEFKNNLYRFYSLSTVYNDFEDWYGIANGIAKELTEEYPQYSIAQIAGVIAVLSPNQSWNSNLASAKVIISEHAKGIRDWTKAIPSPGYGANRAKAFDILSGDLSRISGPKVSAFYSNILKAGDNESVTVDIHMIRAAYADIGIGRNTPNSAVTLPNKIYSTIQQALIELANELNIAVHRLQAIIWEAIRRISLTENERSAYGSI